MNVYIENYIKQASLFFPVVEKAEKSYLAQLSRSIEDYFAEQEPTTSEAIVEVFGPPQMAVKQYLVSTDTSQLVRRIRVRKYIRFFVAVLLSLCLIAALVMTVHLGLGIRILQETRGYEPPVFSTDGTRLE